MSYDVLTYGLQCVNLWFVERLGDRNICHTEITEITEGLAGNLKIDH